MVLRRYSFIILFLGALASFSWWAGQVSSRATPEEPTAFNMETPQRRELIEVLDRLVAYQQYYHSVYGHYTKLLSRLGYSIPGAVLERYDVRIAEASRERFLMVAFSERDGRTQDLISIDQEYAIRSNFDVPVPRPEYLRLVALKQLRSLRDAPIGEVGAEQGVFRGYFKYEVTKDSHDRKVAYAVGTRVPVAGIRLEAGSGADDSADILNELILQDGVQLGSGVLETRTGEGTSGNAMSTLEEAYLAQRIFHGEVGRYARSWAELARITKFRFEDKDRYVEAGQVPFGDTEPISVDQVSQESGREPAASFDEDFEPLEIEPVYGSGKK